MKKIIFIFFLYSSLVLGQKGFLERSRLIIPPKQIIRIDYPVFSGYEVKIWNKSKFALGVSTLNRVTDSVIKSFELIKGKTAELIVNEDLYLQFKNRFLTTLIFEYTLKKGRSIKKKKPRPLTPQRAFYLENNTAQSLPLLIPGVMSPNLSPFSRSGVDLPNGQKIYLKLNDKQILLLIVTDSIQNGARIDVASLIDNALNKK
jgi:hypothetical protein|tara:strand:+ start:1048 stop:1656 length:609 start_codon:yes stop_codon:yes gene_type:complete